jgi:hypothetical protein
VCALVTIKFFVDGGKKVVATAAVMHLRVRENLVARNLSRSLKVQGPSVGFFFKLRFIFFAFHHKLISCLIMQTCFYLVARHRFR